jgi:hypothetical protein
VAGMVSTQMKFFQDLKAAIVVQSMTFKAFIDWDTAIMAGNSTLS